MPRDLRLDHLKAEHKTLLEKRQKMCMEDSNLQKNTEEAHAELANLEEAYAFDWALEEAAGVMESEDAQEVVSCVWNQAEAESFESELERVEDAIRAREKRVSYIRKRRQKEPPKGVRLSLTCENLLEVVGIPRQDRRTAKMSIKPNGDIHIYYGGQDVGDGPGHGHMVVRKYKEEYRIAYDRKPVSKREHHSGIETVKFSVVAALTL